MTSRYRVFSPPAGEGVFSANQANWSGITPAANKNAPMRIALFNIITFEPIRVCLFLPPLSDILGVRWDTRMADEAKEIFKAGEDFSLPCRAVALARLSQISSAKIDSSRKSGGRAPQVGHTSAAWSL